MDNVLIVVDPDDIVPKLGFISFRHPDCEVYRLPDDKGWIDLKDHNMDNFMQHFLQKTEEDN